MENQKADIFGKTLTELQELAVSIGMQRFVGNQITEWIYKKRIGDFDLMTNISKRNIGLLKENYFIGIKNPTTVSNSNDGTKKYLYETSNGRFIEAAYIPEETRNTLCVSSQVGCKMGCEFCMTGRQKFHGNLSAGEIINQVWSLPEVENLTNIVYMGMGEPMDNYDEVKRSIDVLTADWGFGWSPKRINVSTVGLIPSLTKFIEETEAHLAISLHTPFDEQRKQIMPVQKAYPIKDVVDLLKKYDWKGQRRVSFEYIVFDGMNHSQRHVKELARLLNGLKCRINLIRFHTIPDSDLKTTTDNNLLEFQKALKSKGLVTTIRASRGQDIDAACGLLSTKKLLEKQ